MKQPFSTALVLAGLAIVGLEPSCLFTLKDELAAVIPGEPARRIAAQAMPFEEFLVSAHRAGRIPQPRRRPGHRFQVRWHRDVKPVERLQSCFRGRRPSPLGEQTQWGDLGERGGVAAPEDDVTVGISRQVLPCGYGAVGRSL